jgi:polysaccharide pyruvyl transferase WcaK-like protein
MRKSDHIVLLNPALEDNEGNPSSNLGDLIIGDSIFELLRSIFPGRNIIQFSSHSFLNKKARQVINSSCMAFIGGTNLLYSDMITYRQLALRKGKLLWLFPGIRDLVLIGAGWGPDYQNKLNWRTSILYNNILHKKILHSVRDSFTANKLAAETRRKTINTACTSMWKLDGVGGNLQVAANTCLFTLTDYRKNEESDNQLIHFLLGNFSDIHFFPQGRADLDYIKSLQGYNQNRARINLLPHDLTAFKEFTAKESFVYIGTRLHGGIACLNAGKKAVILAVDNRAREIGKDFFLPVIPRNKISILTDWLGTKNVFSRSISLPMDNIKQWTSQFNQQ